MRIIFNSWNESYKELQDDDDTLALMDGFNRTRHEKKGTTLEAAAREAYEKEWVYFATALEGEKPFAFLKMNQGYFNVNFLDEHLRLFRLYEWTRRENGKIFLKEAQSWEFEGNTDEMVSSTSFYSKEDGTMTIIKTLLPSRETDQKQYQIDVSRHWVDFPKFGEYEAIMDMDLVDWELGKVI